MAPPSEETLHRHELQTYSDPVCINLEVSIVLVVITRQEIVAKGEMGYPNLDIDTPPT